MKKIKYLFILLFMFVLIPRVDATSLSLKLDCGKTAKIGDSVTCKILATTSGGKISDISATTSITYPGQESGDTEAFSSFDFPDSASTTNKEVGTITVSGSKITKKGNLAISLSISNATDSNGDSVSLEQNGIINTSVSILNNDASLIDITLDGESIFDEYTNKEYTYNKSEVIIGATLNDSNGSIKSGTGNISLKCGKNTYEIKTLAEDKTKSETYKITINRTCDETSTLKEIKLSSGALDPTFSSNTTSYTVKVSKDIEKLTITPVTTSDKATYKINDSDNKEVTLDYGDNEIKIVVTSENNTSMTYKLTINREDSRNTNTYLSELSLSDGKLLFDKDTYEYNVKVLNEVTSITVDAKAEVETTKVEITGGDNLIEGDNTIIIKLTSEKGDEKEYKIIVKRLKEGETLGDNPKIKDITIKGYDLGFKSGTNNYTLKIDKETTLDIDVTMEEDTATYVIAGNKDLKNKSVITIKTMSEDGTEETYKIVIEKGSSILIFVIAGVAVVLAGLAIFLIIKNKNKNKGKDKSKDKVVTNTVVKDNGYKNKTSSIEKEEVLEELPEYKVCPLCGHKISFESKICPYCKKNFNKIN